MSKKRICRLAEVSRASIYWSPQNTSTRSRYKKSDDSVVLAETEEVLKDRSTYGYKRVTAMINKMRKIKGASKVNRKKVYRIMDMHGLLLKKELIKRDHEATGKIITLHSNTRWCSDAFEIHCYNGEKVYVAFCLDTHDREAVSYIAYDRPLLAVDIQKLMIESVNKRFGKDKAPRGIQFLSDRGAIYRAKETIEMGRRLGLKSCFTKAYTPQSNGMSESLVGTMKRDYVYTSDCVDAKTTLGMIEGWFKDYNEEAPHSGLGMMSPMEYKKLIN